MQDVTLYHFVDENQEQMFMQLPGFTITETHKVKKFRFTPVKYNEITKTLVHLKGVPASLPEDVIAGRMATIAVQVSIHEYP